MADRCTCCDLPTYSCGKAAEQRQRAEQAAHRDDMLRRGWFEARYPGVCDRCGEPFGAGSLIARDLDSYRGECCAEVRHAG